MIRQTLFSLFGPRLHIGVDTTGNHYEIDVYYDNMGFWFLYPKKGYSSFPSLLIAAAGLLCLSVQANALAQPLEQTLDQRNDNIFSDGQQKVMDGRPDIHTSSGSDPQKPIQDGSPPTHTLKNLLDALEVMQSAYFEVWQGTWPTSIDWTAAVMGTHVSATLSTLSTQLDGILNENKSATAGGCTSAEYQPFDAIAYENLISHYFQQLTTFYFGENAFSLRMQAYDDMLWVVLGWLENIKFQNLHSGLHYSSYSEVNGSLLSTWYGTQFRAPAAHRARLFYDLASQGWDTSLCGGGMVWSPYLTPYKNAITNELFISASISMYLYFPGDSIDSPLQTQPTSDAPVSKPHNPAHLNAAITAYSWLKDSNMTRANGLYGDGFHIRGWNGRTSPGSRKCDVFNSMAYTYNQGVVLSGLRGLWLATGNKIYLEDAHKLVENVIKATGWPDTSSQRWQGLGRGGVLEEACDSSSRCSQNGHTFKGIFFHHFAELCRPLSPSEEGYISTQPDKSNVHDRSNQRADYEWHQNKCHSYHSWVQHNAKAAFVTKDKDGKFGMWWGRHYPDNGAGSMMTSPLPDDAIDYSNEGPFADGDMHHPRLLRHLTYDDKYRSAPMKVGNPSTPVHIGNKASESESRIARDVNDRGRGRTVESQSGAVAVLRALFQWESTYK
ncbi:hypothetical protein FQN55_005461 [Onygenales sp. PD_40]|nr:hypothetical protein FQN55_005461 [Onygenales sp. PD_40]